MRSAPDDGFSWAICRIQALGSGGILGGMVVALDVRFQNKRKPERCQRSRVSGRKTSRASLQCDRRVSIQQRAEVSEEVGSERPAVENSSH